MNKKPLYITWTIASPTVQSKKFCFYLGNLPEHIGKQLDDDKHFQRFIKTKMYATTDAYPPVFDISEDVKPFIKKYLFDEEFNSLLA